MALESDESTPARFAFSDDVFEVGLPEPVDKQRLYALKDILTGWGFPPDYETRAATEPEINSLEGLPGAQQMLRNRGVAIYSSPLRVRRTADRADGLAFDALCAMLRACGEEVGDQRLAELVKKARLDNLPPGASARDYYA